MNLPVSQIFLTDDGGNNVPETLLQFNNTIKEGFPHAKYQRFNNKTLRAFIEKNFDEDVLDAYDSLRSYSNKADLGRFCLLYVLGGWYFDMGIRLNVPVTFDENIDFFAFRERQRFTGTCWACMTAVLFSKPSNPALLYAIQQIVSNVKNQYYGLTPLSPTATPVLGQALAKHGEQSSFAYGDFMELTPIHKKQNLAFVLPDGTIMAWAKPADGGDLSSLGAKGVNNYNDLWHKRELYNQNKCLQYVFNCESADQAPISFGITTNFCNKLFLTNLILSIRSQQIPNYEILLIGPEQTDEYQKCLCEYYNDLRFIPFDETQRPAWITKKKNMLAQEAKYDRLLLLHDYLMLSPEWYKNLLQLESKHGWSLLAFPQQRLDGGRFWYDWGGFEGPRAKDRRLFFSYTDWSQHNKTFIVGNVFAVNKHLLLDYPLNEEMLHMDEEDIEWSDRVRPVTHFKCAYNCLVIHQKEHRDQYFFEKVDQLSHE